METIALKIGEVYTLENNVKIERTKIGLEGVDVHFRRIKDIDDKQKNNNNNKISNPFKYYTNKTI